MDSTRIIYLLEQELEGKLSAGELLELDELKMQVQNEELVSEIARMIAQQTPVMIDEAEEAAAFRKIMSVDEMRTIPQTHRVHFLRTAWFRYAAAILILFGIGIYIYVSNQNEKPSVTQNNPVPVQNDVAPGGNRATLTLADGSKIVLDSAANGTLAQEGNATIKKKDDQIIYSADSRLPSSLSYNTMATPRGGQYQLSLPDGTQVWLNAESSITYPTSFAERERRVSVTGEVYFEVAKDKTKPFIVKTSHFSPLTSHEEDQGLEIEVLGTHFNINAYQDEQTINTTLLEGSVKLTPPASRITKDLSVLTLKPGQQGQLTDRGLSLAVRPDVEQVMAWKNGIFNFNEVSLEEAMRQLARWYDVEVEYEGKMPQMTFVGEIGRDLKLSQVLKGLNAMGVKFRIEGKKLIVKS